MKEASKPEAEKVKPLNTTLKFEEIGVWTVMREVKARPLWTLPSHRLAAYGKETVTMVPIACRFLRECISVSPWRMGMYLFSELWSSIDGAVGLYFSSRLLNIIQDCITKRQVDGGVLATAVLSRIAFTLVTTAVTSAGRRSERILANRVRYLFEERVIEANLRLDLPTFEDPETTAKINKYFAKGRHGGSWEMFVGLISKLKSFTNIISQIGFLVDALRSQPGSYWFAMICLGKSIVDTTSYNSDWADPTYIWDSNPHYRRMRSLLKMVTKSKHRVEIISYVLKSYIQKEWKKARNLLGDISDDDPELYTSARRPRFLAFLNAFSEDYALAFFACQVYLSPRNFSLSSVVLMQQAASLLTWTFYAIFVDEKSLRQRLAEIKTLYELDKIPKKLTDGDLRYPGDELSSGMELKFENVSFAYRKAENVIKNISFTIGRGQNVVIVGKNGSGKSTLLKLLNRLYDPASGTISIDSTPLRSFIASDVRQSMAILFQTYTHFPTSIRENISLGLPDMDETSCLGEEKRALVCDELVQEAMRLGGSTEIIDKQPKGLDTVLKPYIYSWSTSSSDNAGQEFQEKMQEIEESLDVSSGQWQRLALSRLVFRAAAKHIKLVAVDEPSASLDPKMEYELFERLRDLTTERGKTMIFVTHRFGHVTKGADLILVMEDGCLVEQGKHHELLEMGGEYAKLYNLQAGAFLPESSRA